MDVTSKQVQRSLTALDVLFRYCPSDLRRGWLAPLRFLKLPELWSVQLEDDKLPQTNFAFVAWQRFALAPPSTTPQRCVPRPLLNAAYATPVTETILIAAGIGEFLPRQSGVRRGQGSPIEVHIFSAHVDHEAHSMLLISIQELTRCKTRLNASRHALCVHTH